MKEYRQDTGSAPIDSLLSFEDLFKLYYPRLKKYAYYFLRNTEEADDLVQDVFYQFWKKKNLLDRRKNISSLIFTMLRNQSFF